MDLALVLNSVSSSNPELKIKNVGNRRHFLCLFNSDYRPVAQGEVGVQRFLYVVAFL